jgi:hypothetical protein
MINKLFFDVVIGGIFVVKFLNRVEIEIFLNVNPDLPLKPKDKDLGFKVTQSKQ